MNAGSNDMWTYTIQPGTGALTPTARGKARARQGPMGIAFAAGSSPVTYTPKFAYVTDVACCGGPGESGALSGYTVDASSGGLTLVPGSPFPTGVTPRFVAVDPSGRFAYVVNSGTTGPRGVSGGVSGYLIDATTGALTPIAGSPFASGRGPESVAVDPSGRFAYVANFVDNSVSGYTINSTTGALMPLPGSPFPASFPVSVAVDPTGRFAYVASFARGSVSGYTISANTGALTLIPGSPFAGGPSSSVVVDPTGKFTYVLTSGGIWGYTINATTGSLTPIAGSPFTAGATPQAVVVEPSGKLAYVSKGYRGEGGILGYSINATTGGLKPVAASPSAFGIFVAVDPSGKFAYAVNFFDLLLGGSDVYGESIDATTGALTPIPGSPFATGSKASTSIAVSGEIH